MEEVTGAGLMGVGLALLLVAAIGLFGVPTGEVRVGGVDLGPILRDRKGQALLAVFGAGFLIAGGVVLTLPLGRPPTSVPISFTPAPILTLTPTTTSTPRSIAVDKHPSGLQATMTATATPPPTPTSTPTPACPVEAATDAETLFALIDAEAQAVLTEDMQLIRDIFAPHAIIRNEATDQEWSSPEAYYTEKFRNEVHCRAEHYDYRILKLTDEEALVSTGNRGEWGWETEGCTMTYENPPGADQWHFHKNVFGCWQIVRFTYNVHTQ